MIDPLQEIRCAAFAVVGILGNTQTGGVRYFIHIVRSKAKGGKISKRGIGQPDLIAAYQNSVVMGSGVLFQLQNAVAFDPVQSSLFNELVGNCLSVCNVLLMKFIQHRFLLVLLLTLDELRGNVYRKPGGAFLYAYSHFFYCL